MSKNVEYHNMIDGKYDDSQGKREKIRTPDLERCKYPSVTDFKQLRKWQRRAFALLKDALHVMVNAPMASGKTLLLMILLYFRLRKNKNLKAIISVPQCCIGLGYKLGRFIWGGKKYSFEPNPKNILCESDVAEVDSTIEAIIAFIKNKTLIGSPDYRVVVCTHQTLTLAFERMRKSMNDKELQNLFANHILAIDESHHIKHETFEYGDDEEEEHNKLGQIAYSFLDWNYPVFLTTATPFRADYGRMVSLKHMAKFNGSIFRLAYDEFMKETKWLKKFKYNFTLYKNEYWDGIADIFKVYKDRKTIIFMPNVNSENASGPGFENKQADIEHILKALSPKIKPKLRKNNEFDCHYYEVKSHSGNILKVVEVVNGSGREIQARNRWIQEGNGDVDIIIALGRCKEGFNYDPLSRVILVGARYSPVECLQTIGRGLRDFPGKKDLEIFHLLQSNIHTMYDSDDEMRAAFNKHLSVILVAMLMEDFYFPKNTLIREKKSDPAPSKTAKQENLWTSYFGEKCHVIKSKIVHDMLANRPAFEPKADQWKALEHTVVRAIQAEAKKEGHNILPEHVHRMVFQCKAQFGLRSLRDKGEKFDAEKIDLETLEQMTGPMDFIHVHASKMFGWKEFGEVRRKLFMNKYTDKHAWMVRFAAWQKQHGRIPRDIPGADTEERDLARFREKSKEYDETKKKAG